MFECQQKIIAEQDWLRGMPLSDPRGSVNAAVNLITPPVAPDADLGMIVIESDHYPPMSGSNLICTVTVARETGMVPMIEPRSDEHTSELQSLTRLSYAVFCLKK